LKKKEEAEVRNNLDTLVSATEKTLSDLGDKVPEEDKEKVEEALKDAKEALGSDDVEAMKEQTTKLQEASYKLAEIVYQEVKDEAESESEDETDDAPEAEDEEVADFEVVEEGE
jgi:molecular chaperone DnaK